MARRSRHRGRHGYATRLGRGPWHIKTRHLKGYEPRPCRYCGDPILFEPAPYNRWRVVNRDGTPHECPNGPRRNPNSFPEVRVRRIEDGELPPYTRRRP